MGAFRKLGVKKMTKRNEDLRNEYIKAVENGDDLRIEEIARELMKRHRAKIFRAAVNCCKNQGRNQFEYAASFADACLSDRDYFCTNESYEISSCYTKSGNPVVVYF